MASRAWAPKDFGVRVEVLYTVLEKRAMPPFEFERGVRRWPEQVSEKVLRCRANGVVGSVANHAGFGRRAYKRSMNA